MGGLVVDLNGHLPPAVFNHEVGKPAVLVDVGEGILGIEIAGLFGTESVGEQFNEQILGTAVGGRAVGRLEVTSTLRNENIVLLCMVQETTNFSWTD